MDDARRERFDALLESAISRLPAQVRVVIDETPLIVEDRPDAALARSLYDESPDAHDRSLDQFAAELCGLHSGVPLTERSVGDAPEMPSEIRLFRDGIIDAAGGWSDRSERSIREAERAIVREILITILHEVGHHFGLDEDDLEDLGYG